MNVRRTSAPSSDKYLSTENVLLVRFISVTQDFSSALLENVNWKVGVLTQFIAFFRQLRPFQWKVSLEKL